MNLPRMNRTFKRILSSIPLAADFYWQVRPRDSLRYARPYGKKFSLERVAKNLPEWTSQASAARYGALGEAGQPTPPRRLMLFSSLRYWIEYATLLGMSMAGLGHEVSLTYMPYPNWRKPLNRFDQHRLMAYAQNVLNQASPLLKAISLMEVDVSSQALPAALEQAIREVSLRDVQYTLQVEEVDLNHPLYLLRLERNTQAARAALCLMETQRPDTLITPNGSILEMGAVYEVARHQGIPVVTYEFGEQRGRIWMAQDDEVMRQETGALWEVFRDQPLDQEQWKQIRALFASRQYASLWQNFARLWQGQPAQGGEKVRQELDLDRRPIVLLPANVIGDSLTLGRQIFSQSMTEWLQGTVRYFALRPDVQLVVRIHPGERYLKGGPSVAGVVQSVLTEIGKDPSTAHIHLVAAQDPINTYDLVDVADIGLVYTTTVGMEMAMSGVPVVVAGQTHYRGKGFTLDPDSWEGYTEQLDQVIADPKAFRLSRQQVEQAWNYAYRFYFDYPLPFPWHLLDFWKQLKTWSIERVLSGEGQAQYGDTFRYLAGIPRDFRHVA